MANDYEIKVDGESGQPVVHTDHGVYGLGCKPKNVSAYADSFPPVGAVYPDIPQSQWTEQDMRPFCPPVLNQGQTAACGPHAVAEAVMTAFANDSDERPDLTPWFTYGILTHGQDVGTALPDLLMAATKYGLPLKTSVKYGDFSGRYAKPVYDEALRFRIEAAYNSPTLANLCSASERRQTSVIGIDIGADFTPDAAGFLPPFRPSPKGVLGHAITVVGKKFAQGLWWPLIMNHWTTQWGMAGFANLHPTYINPYFGAWTLRIPALDPLNANNPPPAVL